MRKAMRVWGEELHEAEGTGGPSGTVESKGEQGERRARPRRLSGGWRTRSNASEFMLQQLQQLHRHVASGPRSWQEQWARMDEDEQLKLMYLEMHMPAVPWEPFASPSTNPPGHGHQLDMQAESDVEETQSLPCGSRTGVFGRRFAERCVARAIRDELRAASNILRYAQLITRYRDLWDCNVLRLLLYRCWSLQQQLELVDRVDPSPVSSCAGVVAADPLTRHGRWCTCTVSRRRLPRAQHRGRGGGRGGGGRRHETMGGGGRPNGTDTSTNFDTKRCTKCGYLQRHLFVGHKKLALQGQVAPRARDTSGYRVALMRDLLRKRRLKLIWESLSAQVRRRRFVVLIAHRLQWRRQCSWLRKCFGALLLHHMIRRQIRRRLRHLRKERQNQTMSRVFHAMNVFRLYRQQRRQKKQAASAHHGHFQMRIALRACFANVLRRHNTRRVTVQCRLHARRQVVRKALRGWRDEVHYVRSLRSRMVSLVYNNTTTGETTTTASASNLHHPTAHHRSTTSTLDAIDDDSIGSTGDARSATHSVTFAQPARLTLTMPQFLEPRPSSRLSSVSDHSEPVSGAVDEHSDASDHGRGRSRSRSRSGSGSRSRSGSQSGSRSRSHSRSRSGSRTSSRVSDLAGSSSRNSTSAAASRSLAGSAALLREGTSVFSAESVSTRDQMRIFAADQVQSGTAASTSATAARQRAAAEHRQDEREERHTPPPSPSPPSAATTGVAPIVQQWPPSPTPSASHRPASAPAPFGHGAGEDARGSASTPAALSSSTTSTTLSGANDTEPSARDLSSERSSPARPGSADSVHAPEDDDEHFSALVLASSSPTSTDDEDEDEDDDDDGGAPHRRHAMLRRRTPWDDDEVDLPAQLRSGGSPIRRAPRQSTQSDAAFGQQTEHRNARPLSRDEEKTAFQPADGSQSRSQSRTQSRSRCRARSCTPADMLLEDTDEDDDGIDSANNDDVGGRKSALSRASGVGSTAILQLASESYRMCCGRRFLYRLRDMHVRGLSYHAARAHWKRVAARRGLRPLLHLLFISQRREASLLHRLTRWTHNKETVLLQHVVREWRLVMVARPRRVVKRVRTNRLIMLRYRAWCAWRNEFRQRQRRKQRQRTGLLLSRATGERRLLWRWARFYTTRLRAAAATKRADMFWSQRRHRAAWQMMRVWYVRAFAHRRCASIADSQFRRRACGAALVRLVTFRRQRLDARVKYGRAMRRFDHAQLRESVARWYALSMVRMRWRQGVNHREKRLWAGTMRELLARWRRKVAARKLLRRVFTTHDAAWEVRMQHPWRQSAFNLLMDVVSAWRSWARNQAEMRTHMRMVLCAQHFRNTSLMAQVWVPWKRQVQVSRAARVVAARAARIMCAKHWSVWMGVRARNREVIRRAAGAVSHVRFRWMIRCWAQLAIAKRHARLRRCQTLFIALHSTVEHARLCARLSRQCWQLQSRVRVFRRLRHAALDARARRAKDLVARRAVLQRGMARALDKLAKHRRACRCARTLAGVLCTVQRGVAMRRALERLPGFWQIQRGRAALAVVRTRECQRFWWRLVRTMFVRRVSTLVAHARLWAARLLQQHTSSRLAAQDLHAAVRRYHTRAGRIHARANRRCVRGIVRAWRAITEDLIKERWQTRRADLFHRVKVFKRVWTEWSAQCTFGGLLDSLRVLRAPAVSTSVATGVSVWSPNGVDELGIVRMRDRDLQAELSDDDENAADITGVERKEEKQGDEKKRMRTKHSTKAAVQAGVDIGAPHPVPPAPPGASKGRLHDPNVIQQLAQHGTVRKTDTSALRNGMSVSEFMSRLDAAWVQTALDR